MTQEQTLQSFEDLIKSLEENGVGYDAPTENAFSVFGNNISDMTPANFYAAFGDSDSLTAGNGVYRIVRNMDGSVRAFNFTDNWGNMSEVESLENYLNSNTAIPQYDPANSFTYTRSTNIETSGQTINLTGGLSKYANGALQSAKHVTAAGMLSAVPFAAGIGVSLGKSIDAGLYKLLDAMGADPPEALNPETWAQVAQQDDFAGWAFRTLFDIDPTTGKATQYVDANATAYMSLWLKEQGFFDEAGSSTADYAGSTSPFPAPGVTSLPVGGGAFTPIDNRGRLLYDYVCMSSGPVYSVCFSSGNAKRIYVVSASDLTVVQKQHNSETVIRTDTYRATHNTFNDTPYAWYSNEYSSTYDPQGVPVTTAAIPIGTDDGQRQVATIILDGNVTTPSTLPGVSDNGGTAPNVSTWTTPATTLVSLQQQYPDWWDNRIEETITNPDGTTTTYTYLPFTLPNEQTDGNPDTQTNDPTETEVDPETVTQTKLQTIIELLTNPRTTTLVDPTTSTQTGTNENNPTSNPNAPDTGTGNQSPFVAPTGSASSLWAVYHPSQAQLNAFGAWLWSSDFVEQLKRLFNDPMQAIIGVHKVFAPIPTGDSQTIKCGYLDSGVSSPVVSAQYTDVNCGTVNCREYFGNVFDYDPHTRVSIYLPFIGVVPLKVSEVMRASITVTYGVDVITGACLAKVKVDRDGGGAILYSFGGSCACHYPISAGSYAGIISGIVTSAVGVAGGIMTGNPLAAAGGVLAGARQAHTDVQHSGGFTGCAGAMGPKIPYLIITRPQTRIANNVQLYEGKPSNATQFIGDCTGFVRATEVHFSSQAAFDDEAKEVEALLKSGVLISD